MVRCSRASTCRGFLRCETYSPPAPPAGSGGSEPFSKLYSSTAQVILPEPQHDSRLTIATLPFSSGTTGLPKGVMLSHHNLVANVFQTLTSGETGSIGENTVVLCFLPMYHIYGMTVGMKHPKRHAHAK